MLVHGIHPTLEALAAGRVSSLWVADRQDGRLRDVIDRAASAGVSVRRVDRTELDRLAPGASHQGVVARVGRLPTYGVGDLVAGASRPLLLVLDGIEDPHNFGAAVRSAEAAGSDGVIYQTRRASPPSGAAVKASAGALAHVRLAPVVNIARALAVLSDLGVWTVGLDAGAERPYYEVDYTAPVAVVVGAEDRGLRRLVRERCDWLASIPMRGRVGSLNASVAAGIVLFEAVRQRLAE